jgi:hypothetical protein
MNSYTLAMKSEMLVGVLWDGFDMNGLWGQIPPDKADNTTLSFRSSAINFSRFKRAMKSFSDSCSSCFTVSKYAIGLHRRRLPIKCDKKLVPSSVKVPMDHGGKLLKQRLAIPFRVSGKALHMISSKDPCSAM